MPLLRSELLRELGEHKEGKFWYPYIRNSTREITETKIRSENNLAAF